MTEKFDVYDERGNWTGTEAREAVHTQGLWHHTVHCWLVRRTGPNKANILFQLRSNNKDTNPNKFDVTAAGHLSAGETPKDVVRELDEELGVQVTFDQLAEYGTIREKATGFAQGKAYIDAEVSHVYGLVTTQGLLSFKLQEDEVSGLYEADTDELIALLEGHRGSLKVSGVALTDGQLHNDESEISCNSFVSRDYGYYIAVFRFLRDLASTDSRD